MELFTANIGWDAMQGSMLFTSSMLVASVVHAPLAAPLDAHLARWDEQDAEGRRADRGVVKANARVAWLDLTLDTRTLRYSTQLVADLGDRGHKTFKAFFPVAPGKVTRLGLESQLKAMSKFPELAAEISLPAGSDASLKQVLAVFPLGETALEERAAAEGVVTRMSVRGDAWRDEANKLRRAVETALDDYANKNDLPRDYASWFFPTTKSKPAKSEPTESDAVLALPDAALRALSATYIATLPAETQTAVHARLSG